MRKMHVTIGNSAFTLGLLRISAGDMPLATRTALAQLLLRDTATAAQRHGATIRPRGCGDA
jgi:hypothetical protein